MKWKLAKNESPKPGKRVVVLLPDMRVCSGFVTISGGIKLDHVDSLDLFSADIDKVKWLYLN